MPSRLPIPPISLWPPPREPRIAAELLEAVERRDPLGHAIHLILAGIFFLFAGVSTATLDFSSVPLLFYAALRLPNTWRAYPPVLATFSAVAFPAWIIWTALTLFWTSDLATGFEHFQSFRMVLLVAALWPVIRHRRGLALCLVIGMCVQTGAIALNAIGALPTDAGGLRRYLGFGSHSGHVTLWLSMAALTAIALLRGAGRVERWLLVAAVGIVVVGAFSAGGRGSQVGLVAGAIAILVVAVSSGRLSAKQWLTTAVALVVIAGATIALRGNDIRKAYSRIERQLAKAESNGDPRSSSAYRLYWWQLSLEQWRAAPIVGTGFGSWKEWATAQPQTIKLAERLEASTDDLILAHPHSVYLQTLGETGLVGEVLLLSAGIAILLRTRRGVRRDPVMLAGFATIVLWTVASGFEGNHISSRPSAALAIAISFATLPTLLPGRHQVPRADTGAA